MKARFFNTCVQFSILLVLCGCASYPERVDDIKTDLTKSTKGDSLEYTIYPDSGRNKLLALMERGRLAQLQGKYNESSKAYAEAIAFSDAIEDKALVSVGDALDSTLAVTYGNDLALEYPVVGFERMMLHVLDGFDRLALGDVDGFGVDMRNLERCRGMTKTRLKRDMEILLKKKGLRRASSLKQSSATVSYDDFMNTIKIITPGLKHSVDNAYALYLMALYREAKGDYREALAFYKEIEGLSLIKDTNVSRGIDLCNGESVPEGCGDVILFFEEGFIPPKRTNHAVFDHSLYFTLPNYATADCLSYQDGGPLVMLENGKSIAKTQYLCDLAPLAILAHEERMRGMVARKALTASITSGAIALNNVVNGSVSINPFAEALLLIGGMFTATTANIMVAASERPDLRSWLLLPREVKMLRCYMPEGRHEITLYSVDKTANLTIDVKHNAKTIIHCTSENGNLTCFAANINAVNNNK